jgi:hypothetical protein
MPNLGIKTYLEKYIRNVLKNREKLKATFEIDFK